jgi:hypothetical protein
VVVMLDSSVVKFAGLLNVLFAPNSNLTQHKQAVLRKTKAKLFPLFVFVFYLIFGGFSIFYLFYCVIHCLIVVVLYKKKFNSYF